MYSIKQNWANVSKYSETDPPKASVYLHFIYEFCTTSKKTIFHYKDQSLGAFA
jgi:hypothetical protein